MTEATNERLNGNLVVLDDERSVFVAKHNGDIMVKFTNGDLHTPLRLSREAAHALSVLISVALDDELD
jgi:hypothetical protein